jgi:hypothetical protein
VGGRILAQQHGVDTARPAATRVGVALALIAVSSAGLVLLALDLTGLAPGLTLWALAARRISPAR